MKKGINAGVFTISYVFGGAALLMLLTWLISSCFGLNPLIVGIVMAVLLFTSAIVVWEKFGNKDS